MNTKELPKFIVRTTTSAILAGSALAPIEPPRSIEAGTVPDVSILWPQNGEVMEGMGIAAKWNVSPDVLQLHVQVIPANNDGPGVDTVLGNYQTVQRNRNWGVSKPTVRPEKASSCFALPDMGYLWRMRGSVLEVADPKKDEDWSPWSESSFRTPARGSGLIDAVSPGPQGRVESLTPRLQWQNPNSSTGSSDVFYYEVQVSKDGEFELDPARAKAPVYYELVNVCANQPPYMYYQVPEKYPLETNQTYFWRVRPRVQGDGTPVGWSPTLNFQTGPNVLKDAPQGTNVQDVARINAVMEELREQTRLETNHMKATVTKEGVLVQPRRPNRQERRHPTL